MKILSDNNQEKLRVSKIKKIYIFFLYKNYKLLLMQLIIVIILLLLAALVLKEAKKKSRENK